MTASGSPESEQRESDTGALPGAPMLRTRGQGADIDVRARASALGVDARLVSIMVGRGVEDEDAQRRLLNPRLGHLRPPTDMAGFGPALALLQQARRDGWRVGIFGDYDVDGVTTTTILSTFLEVLGIEVVSQVGQKAIVLTKVEVHEYEQAHDRKKNKLQQP